MNELQSFDPSTMMMNIVTLFFSPGVLNFVAFALGFMCWRTFNVLYTYPFETFFIASIYGLVYQYVFHFVQYVMPSQMHFILYPILFFTFVRRIYFYFTVNDKNGSFISHLLLSYYFALNGTNVVDAVNGANGIGANGIGANKLASLDALLAKKNMNIPNVKPTTNSLNRTSTIPTDSNNQQMSSPSSISNITTPIAAVTSDVNGTSTGTSTPQIVGIKINTDEPFVIPQELKDMTEIRELNIEEFMEQLQKLAKESQQLQLHQMHPIHQTHQTHQTHQVQTSQDTDDNSINSNDSEKSESESDSGSNSDNEIC